MISPDIFAPPQSALTRSKEQMNGLSRLFAAAVVNRQFREALLREPCTALSNGYPGQVDPLSQEEKDLIISIRANSLPELAQQVDRALRNGPWA
jgi:hypothetical protein